MQRVTRLKLLPWSVTPGRYLHARMIYTGACKSQRLICKGWKQSRGQRSFSFLPNIPAAGGGASPGMQQFPTPSRQITFEQARGAAETMLLYFENGEPGESLVKIHQEKEKPIGARYRSMMDIFFRTQFHVIIPFGFSVEVEKGNQADPMVVQQSLQDFSTALFYLVTQLSQQSKTEAVTELQTLSNELMMLMLRKAFEVEHLPEVTTDQMRLLSSRLSVNFQDPTFLSMAESLYAKYKQERQPKTPTEEAMILASLQDELLVPCYLAAINDGEIQGLQKGDKGYVLLQTLITQHLNDPVVAQNLSAGLMALNSKVPLFGLPGQ